MLGQGKGNEPLNFSTSPSESRACEIQLKPPGHIQDAHRKKTDYYYYDNVPHHTAGIVKDILEVVITQMNWPAWSPNMNLIEQA